MPSNFDMHEIIRLVGEALVILFSLFLTYRNKNKTKEIDELEETVKRLRIEVVVQEEKIAQLTDDLRYERDTFDAYKSKHEKNVSAHAETQAKIENIKTYSTKSKSVINELIKV